MKKIFSLFLILLTIGLSSCKKEEYTTYDAPQWAMQSGDYSESMSAVVTLPSDILPYFSEQDEMAIFINNECRGIATIVDGLFYINVLGTSSEMDPITIRYYSARNRYKYEQVTDINFEPNRVIGTVDEPFVPTFINI